MLLLCATACSSAMLTGGLSASRAGGLSRSAPAVPHASRAAVSMALENMFGEMISITPGMKTYMMGVDIKQDKYKTLENTWEVKESLEELARLCATAELDVVGQDFQNMQHPNPSTFIGKGKVEELALEVQRLGVGCVVFDDELTPGQGRNLQRALEGKVQVIDRTMLILQIFSQRARTKEAMLQVQAAQLEYMMPRLQTYLTTGAGMDSKGGASSGGGGQFLKGAGESQLEMPASPSPNPNPILAHPLSRRVAARDGQAALPQPAAEHQGSDG